jgi:hypothetical protein
MTRLRARFVGHQAASRASTRRAVEVEDSLVAARSCVATSSIVPLRKKRR